MNTEPVLPPPKRTRPPVPPPEAQPETSKPLPIAFAPQVNWICQITSPGPLFGITGLIGDIQPDHLWVYAIGQKGAKLYFKVRSSDIFVVGPGRIFARETVPRNHLADLDLTQEGSDQ